MHRAVNSGVCAVLAATGLGQRVLSGFALMSVAVVILGCSGRVARPVGGLQRPASPKQQPVKLVKLPSSTKHPTEAGWDALDGFPVAVADKHPMLRVLRGDYEPPDTLLLSYEDEWSVSVEQIVRAARGQAHVLLLAGSEVQSEPSFRRIAKEPHVSVVRRTQDSPWVRDYGPLQTYEFDSGPLWLDYHYAWDRPVDDKIPEVLSPMFKARLEAPSVALDGGAVVSNGEGLCAITRTSLIDAGFTDPAGDELETFLAALGCGVTAVLPTIVEETTGHADVFAQFLAKNIAVLAWVDPEDNPELSQLLDQSASNLEKAAELGNYELQILRVPMQAFGETFYSYVNATRLKTRLLVPHFEALTPEVEDSAYAALASALPGVSLAPIDAEAMTRLGGAVHCITLGLGPTRPYPKLPRLRREDFPQPAAAKPRRRG